MNEREFWVNGKYDAPVCVSAIRYPQLILVTADTERLTERKFFSALQLEYPNRTWTLVAHSNRDYYIAEGRDAAQLAEQAIIAAEGFPILGIEHGYCKVTGIASDTMRIQVRAELRKRGYEI